MDVVRDYALLALRIDRLVAESPSGNWILDYRGPERYRAEVVAEPLPNPAQLIAAAEELAAAVDDVALAEQIGALHTMARLLAGERLSLRDQVRGMLGIEVDWIPDAAFDEAYELLDRGLPQTGGTLAERMEAWRTSHTLPTGDTARLAELVLHTVDESRRRSEEFLPLPEKIDITCEFAPGPFRGLYRGGPNGTVFVDPQLPFNLADLCYVVTHEAFPGHICEFMMKQDRLADRPDIQVRVMPSPAFVVSEGIGLHAEHLIFPGDQAQRWLVDTVDELQPDSSDYAAIHHAENMLFGAYCNAAFLVADGAPWPHVRDYLGRTALLPDLELAFLEGFFDDPFLRPYIFAYYHGWRLLQPRASDRTFMRKVLTEQIAVSSL
ncbi:hypothetical protein [Nocardia transvalensis]|uniref:hypothetical protein n=1 Tax=Nocardia transvalensis TaxID=37333 RepID=UPI001895C168|nr:hypothetical protein [Nocardia transvalensis]MBF6328767.1 hypothetical protein [Nocardia transvalensis]